MSSWVLIPQRERHLLTRRGAERTPSTVLGVYSEEWTGSLRAPLTLAICAAALAPQQVVRTRTAAGGQRDCGERVVVPVPGQPKLFPLSGGLRCPAWVFFPSTGAGGGGGGSRRLWFRSGSRRWVCEPDPGPRDFGLALRENDYRGEICQGLGNESAVKEALGMAPGT